MLQLDRAFATGELGGPFVELGLHRLAADHDHEIFVANAGKNELGELVEILHWHLEAGFLGTRHEVVVSPGRDEVRVTTTRRPSAGVIVGLHRLHKGGGGWKYDLWMVLYDAACLALILFAASGIYLWFKRTQKRALGWTLLALSFGYATAVTLYLVHAP